LRGKQYHKNVNFPVKAGDRFVLVVYLASPPSLLTAGAMVGYVSGSVNIK
jgi:hypothetical protein